LSILRDTVEKQWAVPGQHLRDPSWFPVTTWDQIAWLLRSATTTSNADGPRTMGWGTPPAWTTRGQTRTRGGVRSSPPGMGLRRGV
jgi:hypothetical protein